MSEREALVEAMGWSIHKDTSCPKPWPICHCEKAARAALDVATPVIEAAQLERLIAKADEETIMLPATYKTVTIPVRHRTDTCGYQPKNYTDFEMHLRTHRKDSPVWEDKIVNEDRTVTDRPAGKYSLADWLRAQRPTGGEDV